MFVYTKIATPRMIRNTNNLCPEVQHTNTSYLLELYLEQTIFHTPCCQLVSEMAGIQEVFLLIHNLIK